jgi:hypothetical protein
MPDQSTDEVLLEQGLSVLESQLGPIDALRFIALVSRQPFNYQRWREDRFGGLSVDEICARMKSKRECGQNG